MRAAPAQQSQQLTSRAPPVTMLNLRGGSRLMTAAVCVAPVALLWIGEAAAAYFFGQDLVRSDL